MAKFDRYVLSQLIVVFGLAALVLVTVYWIQRAVRLFDQIISSGESATVFLELSVLTLPGVIKVVLPIAAFVSAVYVTNRLSSESELVIVQSSGYSPWRLARPVAIFGILVAIFFNVLAHLLVPASLSRLTERQDQISENVTARLLTEGTFLHPSRGVTFYIARITPEGELLNVFLSDARHEGRRMTYTAERALLIREDEGPTLLMFDGMAQSLDIESRRLAVTIFDEFAYGISSLLEAPPASRRRLPELFTTELLNPTPEILSEARASVAQALAEAHGRVTQSLLCITAPLIGFGALLIGGFSRFGVWRQILAAVFILLVLRGFDTAMTETAASDPASWPALYLPPGLEVAVVLALLWIAANPIRRRRRRAAA